MLLFVDKKAQQYERQANADHKQQLASSWAYSRYHTYIFLIWILLCFFGGFCALDRYSMAAVYEFSIAVQHAALLIPALCLVSEFPIHLHPVEPIQHTHTHKKEKKIKTSLFFSSSRFYAVNAVFIWIRVFVVVFLFSSLVHSRIYSACGGLSAFETSAIRWYGAMRSSIFQIWDFSLWRDKHLDHFTVRSSELSSRFVSRSLSPLYAPQCAM